MRSLMQRYLVGIVVAVLVVASAIALPRTLRAADASGATPPTRSVDVIGRGTLTVKPDTAVLTFGVTALADTATDAYNQVGTTLADVTAILKAAGVKDEQLQTQGLSLAAEYNWTQDKGQVLKGYRSTTTLSITTQDLAGVAKLVELAVSKGANQLQSITFTVKEKEALAQQAMDAAVDNAKAKAERVAKRMGAGLGNVIKVTVQDDGGARPVSDISLGSVTTAKSATPIAVFGGTNEVTVTVTASFELK